MVNRAGNEKAQELYLLSSFSPCSGACSQQASCVPSVAFLSRRRGAHVHSDQRPRQILGPLPREMHTHACQTAPADCWSSENTVTVLICNYVYLFFSFVNLDPIIITISKWFLQAPSHYHHPHSHLQQLLRLGSCPKCFISIVFHLLMNSLR